MFHENFEHRMPSLTCWTCISANREGHIHLFDIFPPEIFVSFDGESTQISTCQRAMIDSLLRDVENEADVLIWTKSTSSTDSAEESKRALERSQIFIVLLSDSYVLSQHCAHEFLTAVHAGKMIVPILIPNESTSEFPGWSGPGSDNADYWKHALSLNDERRDVKNDLISGGSESFVDWSLLGKYTPIQLSHLESKCDEQITPHEQNVNRLVSIISSRIHRAVRLNVYSDLSLFGVKLSYFCRFISECGGREKLEGWTTTEVMEAFVKPVTAATRLSFCEYIMSDGDKEKAVMTAEWFVSHAWKYKFLDVVDALSRHFDGADPVLWFDVFSVSQHKADVRPFEWWNTTFLSAVGMMGRVVMVLQPWDRPVTLGRAWCIFEVFACESTMSEFSIAMTESESYRFMQMIIENPISILEAFKTIRCEESECYKIEDKEQIFEVIRRTVGFSQLDSMVLRKIVQVLCLELQKRNSVPSQDAVSGVKLHRTLIVIQMLRRDYAGVEQQCRELLSRYSTAPDCCLELIRTKIDLAMSNRRLERISDAGAVFEECWGTIHGQLGPDHPLTLLIRSEIAVGHLHRGQIEQAEQLYAACEEANRRIRCTETMHNLATFRELQGRKEEAALLHQICMGLRLETLGRHHPDTLDSMRSLAKVLTSLKNFGEAEALLRECIELRELILGADHPDTEEARRALAGIIALASEIESTQELVDQENYDNSEVQDTNENVAAPQSEASTSNLDTVNVIQIINIFWERMAPCGSLTALRLRNVIELDRASLMAMTSRALSSHLLRKVDLRQDSRIFLFLSV